MSQPTPPRHVINMRPGNDPEALVYSPQRDLVNLYIPMMREAVYGLDRPHWGSELTEHLDRLEVTEAQLGDAVRCLVTAHQMFTGDPRITCPADALDQTPWSTLPYAVRSALLARIGEVLMGGFFVAVRDVTIAGDVPPIAKDIASMVAAGRMLANRLSGCPPAQQPTETEVEQHAQTKAELEITQRAVNRGSMMLQCAYQEVQRLQAVVKDLNLTVLRNRDGLGLGWFQRLFYCVRLWWNKDLL